MKARRFAGVVLAAVMLLGTLFATGQTAWAEGNADTMTSSDTTDTTLVAADDGDVTGVTLVPDTATLAVGETVQLTATISPEDASDKTVIWTVDDDDYVKLYADAGCTIEVSDGTTPTLTVYAKGLAEGSASINVASNQNIVIYDACTVTVNPAHTHSFAYAASGNTINATCSADGCTLPKAEDKPTATLAIVAPGHDTFGDGKDAEATISGNIDGVANPEIVYRRGAEVLPGAPTDAGTYTASITLGDATASVEYTISKAAISPAVSIEGWTCGQEANAPSLTEGSNPGDGEVTYEYAGKGDTDWSAVAPTACGDYTVRATVVETANYLGGTATVDFSIVPAEATSKSDTVPQKNTLPSTGDPLTLAAIAALAAVGAGAVLAGRRHCG